MAQKVLTSVSLVVVLSGCTGVGFNAGNSSASSASTSTGTNSTDGSSLPQNCTTVLKQIQSPVKIIFVLDTSGSNATTDPGKVVRGQSVNQFFTDYSTKTNFSWGMVHFSGTTAPPVIYGASNQVPIFSTQASDMQTAITSFMAMSDSGSTPYKAALKSIASALTNDVTVDVNTKYIVVFASDGVPNPSYPGGDTQLMADVKTLIALKNGEVTFSTVYYGPVDAAASTRLSNMAIAGNGQFLNTNLYPTHTDFEISNLVTIAGQTCPDSK